MISRDVWFFTGDGHGIVDEHGKRTNYSQDIIIGDHVWIGYRAILTKGCKICNNSIIAVGAVCNRSLNAVLSEGCVIGGNPARVVASEKTGLEIEKTENDRMCRRIINFVKDSIIHEN